MDVEKKFNVTGLCVPQKHYMVSLSERVAKIRKMVDAGAYFTINRARQYGKTTTLAALAKSLEEDYLVISLDFQMLGSASFRNENVFALAFLHIFLRELERHPEVNLPDMRETVMEMKVVSQESKEKFDLLSLFVYLIDVCTYSDKPVVLMIDEVDSATNNQVFLDFLAQLRSYYMERDSKGTVTFQSVILAGVYDIKNLKRKLRPEEEHKINSPWNIAADFDINMRLSQAGIRDMLNEYETEHHVGMDTEEMAGLLYCYTSGYPYLVSKLCKIMDERMAINESREIHGRPWTKSGFLKAVRILLSENNTLFESLIGKLSDYPDLSKMLEELLFSGKAISFNPTNPSIQLALMLGFIKNDDGKAVPANRIFDTLLYNYFLSMDEMYASDIYKASLQDKNQFIENGHLNMRKVLEKFTKHFHYLYGECKERFLEDEGRRYFLLYLRPIINGIGNYYIESYTRSLGRTDVIVDYRDEQFVVEMKIWRGNEYNARGEEQLISYLEDYDLDIGYMISFSFNRKKQIGVREISIGGKTLIEAVV